jgi:hypothetical protein
MDRHWWSRLPVDQVDEQSTHVLGIDPEPGVVVVGVVVVVLDALLA